MKNSNLVLVIIFVCTFVSNAQTASIPGFGELNNLSKFFELEIYSDVEYISYSFEEDYFFLYCENELGTFEVFTDSTKEVYYIESLKELKKGNKIKIGGCCFKVGEFVEKRQYEDETEWYYKTTQISDYAGEFWIETIYGRLSLNYHVWEYEGGNLEIQTDFQKIVYDEDNVPDIIYNKNQNFFYCYSCYPIKELTTIGQKKYKITKEKIQINDFLEKNKPIKAVKLKVK